MQLGDLKFTFVFETTTFEPLLAKSSAMNSVMFRRLDQLNAMTAI